jgi:hypothetical protein
VPLTDGGLKWVEIAVCLVLILIGLPCLILASGSMSMKIFLTQLWNPSELLSTSDFMQSSPSTLLFKQDKALHA